MKTGLTNRILLGVVALVLALSPTSATAAQPTTTGTTKPGTSTGATTTGGPTGLGIFGLSLLSAAEEATLMMEATVIVTDVFGVLGSTLPAAEQTFLVDFVYELLVFLTILEELSALMSTTAP